MTLEPKFLGPQLRDYLRLQLYRQVEGSCNGRYGYVVAIVNVDHIEHGIVQDSFGSVAFRIRYTAIVLKPYKNETVDAHITTVNKMGFFATVGPLQVFVSNHVRVRTRACAPHSPHPQLIPADYKFEPNSVPPSYLSDEQGLKIAAGDLVRLKIVGTRIDATEMVRRAARALTLPA